MFKTATEKTIDIKQVSKSGKNKEKRIELAPCRGR